jgi:hypothetical protein
MIPAEWPGQAADAIVDAIGKVRDKATKPAITAARGVVYGTLIAVAGVVAAILATALVFRLFANYFGNRNLWIAYLILGVGLVGAGAVMLRKGNRPPARDDA